MSYRQLLNTVLVLFVSLPSLADPLPRAEPEEVGMSSERLARIGSALKADVEAGRIPGAVVAVARKGRLVYFEAIGYRDKAKNAPMTRDAIFYLASMTKPMVSVGALTLYEEGRLLMTDPISKYLPVGKNPVAVARTDAEGKSVIETVPAKREITVLDLLRHTSGIPCVAAWKKLRPVRCNPGSGTVVTTMTSEQFLAKLASLPLLHQPGTVWDYSLDTDVLGLLQEAVTGQKLGQFLQERLWQPLGMTDTGFSLSPEKRERLAQPLPNDPDTGKRQSIWAATKLLKFECGGACAASTAGNYLRFAQMLLNKGRLGETRILSRKTVEYMTTNQLGPDIGNRLPERFPRENRVGYGYGLGVGVRTQTGVGGPIGSARDYFWFSAWGPYFWVDPEEQLAVVYMAQTPSRIRAHYRNLLAPLVLQSITD